MQLFVDISEQADAGMDIDTCAVTSVTLNALPAMIGEGTWTQPGPQAGFGIEIVDPLDPNTAITGMDPGNTYLFFWNLPANGCPPSSDTVVVQIIDDFSFAGDNFEDCGDGCSVSECSRSRSRIWHLDF